MAAAVVICAVLAVCFLTDPLAENSNDIGQGQKVENRSVDGSSPGENFFVSTRDVFDGGRTAWDMERLSVS